MNIPTPTPSAKSVRIKVIGIGGAGLKIVEQMTGSGLDQVSFALVHTNAQRLAASPVADKMHLESRLLRGLGTGGDPERGRAATEEQAAQLRALCADTDMIFLVAGLGGGTGTGAAPVLARVARECGALVLAFVTLPFECEGARRQRQAQQGMEQLKLAADGVICLPNQKVCKLLDENTSVIETFKLTNDLLIQGVRGIWQLLTRTGPMEIDFADLSEVVRGRHAESVFATSEARGAHRAREVMEKLLAHPLLEEGQTLAEAGAVLVSLMAGPDLTMAEVNRVMEQLHRHCEHAHVTLGAAIDPAWQDRLSVTLIATHRVPAEMEARDPADAAGEAPLESRQPGHAARPASRYVPPAPELTPEKQQQLLARGRRSRSRGGASRMRQSQLPLEIISKGRFDNSEPTIYKGEDLDVPTYIRRGVALN